MNACTPARYTVLYDGHCGVCSRLAQRLAGMDRRGEFQIVDSYANGVRAQFPWISDAAFTESLQVVRETDNTTWEGARAVEQIVSELRGWRALKWLLALPFTRAVADRLYRWFARNRGSFVCGSHCDSRAR